MFKKKFKISTQTTVSNKDKKDVISILKQIYSESQVEKLLTTNTELRHDKLTSSKDSIYTLISDSEGEIPLIACHEAKGGIQELYPSIYAFFKVPFLVPTIFYLKAGVESYITNGAHLMWPGVDRVKVFSPQEQKSSEEAKDPNAKAEKKHRKLNKAYEALRNEVAVIFYKQFLIDDEGNTYMQEVPLAIGRRVAEGVLPSQDKIQKQAKGVAIEVIHCFLDELWNMGNQQINISEE
mmetsp:Transcript_32851/g.37612  ORF Transcript_32851/g.37612 Transcript_32851/m.37612 type:complete len:237 (-) Transcript_32851:1297-2007(-)